jgi:hypothetical protein
MRLFELSRTMFDISLFIVIWSVRLYIFYLMIYEIKYRITNLYYNIRFKHK